MLLFINSSQENKKLNKNEYCRQWILTICRQLNLSPLPAIERSSYAGMHFWEERDSKTRHLFSLFYFNGSFYDS